MTLTEARTAAARRAPSDPLRVVADALARVEEVCRGMNPGTPGWRLRDRVLAVCEGGAKAGDR